MSFIYFVTCSYIIQSYIHKLLNTFDTFLHFLLRKLPIMVRHGGCYPFYELKQGVTPQLHYSRPPHLTEPGVNPRPARDSTADAPADDSPELRSPVSSVDGERTSTVSTASVHLPLLVAGTEEGVGGNELARARVVVPPHALLVGHDGQFDHLQLGGERTVVPLPPPARQPGLLSYMSGERNIRLTSPSHPSHPSPQVKVRF